MRGHRITPHDKLSVVSAEVLGEDPIQVDLHATFIDPTVDKPTLDDIESYGLVIEGFSIADRDWGLVMRGQDVDGERINQPLVSKDGRIHLDAWMQPNGEDEAIVRYRDDPPKVQFRLGEDTTFQKETVVQGGMEMEVFRVNYPAVDPVLKASFYSGWVTVTSIYYSDTTGS